MGSVTVMQRAERVDFQPDSRLTRRQVEFVKTVIEQGFQDLLQPSVILKYRHQVGHKEFEFRWVRLYLDGILDERRLREMASKGWHPHLHDGKMLVNGDLVMCERRVDEEDTLEGELVHPTARARAITGRGQRAGVEVLDDPYRRVIEHEPEEQA